MQGTSLNNGLGVDSLQIKPQRGATPLQWQTVQKYASPTHSPRQDHYDYPKVSWWTMLQHRHFQTSLLYHFLNVVDKTETRLGYNAAVPDKFHNGDLAPNPPHWLDHFQFQPAWLLWPKSSHQAYLLLERVDRRRCL